MARLARLVVPGLAHHITQRGNRRQAVFFLEEDRQFYLDCLAEASRKAGVQIWAYCLMTNHVHLVAVPERESSLGQCLAKVHGRYAQRINGRMGWRGHLWQARFGSSAMDRAYTLAAVRYVEQNPVQAKLVAHAWDYRWSSAAHHVGIVDQDPVIQGDAGLRAEVGNWREFLEVCDPRTMTTALQRETPLCRPLGAEAFIRDLETQWDRQLTRGRRGRPRHEK